MTTTMVTREGESADLAVGGGADASCTPQGGGLNRAERRRAGREGLAELVDEAWSDQAVAQLRADGARLTGPDGFLSKLIKQVLERGLQAELSEHLGYAKHAVEGRGTLNSRNGSSPKTVNTEVGPVAVEVPRDRAGTFTPVLLPKHARSLGGFSDIIISLYAGGMTVRDMAGVGWCADQRCAEGHGPSAGIDHAQPLHARAGRLREPSDGCL